MPMPMPMPMPMLWLCYGPNVGSGRSRSRCAHEPRNYPLPKSCLALQHALSLDENINLGVFAIRKNPHVQPVETRRNSIVSVF